MCHFGFHGIVSIFEWKNNNNSPPLFLLFFFWEIKIIKLFLQIFSEFQQLFPALSRCAATPHRWGTYAGPTELLDGSQLFFLFPS